VNCNEEDRPYTGGRAGVTTDEIEYEVAYVTQE